jgi:hypothetical protein
MSIDRNCEKALTVIMRHWCLKMFESLATIVVNCLCRFDVSKLFDYFVRIYDTLNTFFCSIYTCSFFLFYNDGIWFVAIAEVKP